MDLFILTFVTVLLFITNFYLSRIYGLLIKINTLNFKVYTFENKEL